VVTRLPPVHWVWRIGAFSGFDWISAVDRKYRFGRLLSFRRIVLFGRFLAVRRVDLVRYVLAIEEVDPFASALAADPAVGVTSGRSFARRLGHLLSPVDVPRENHHRPGVPDASGQ
jgi:hypothetical protein